MTVDEAIFDDAQRECTRCGCGSCDQCRVAVLAAEVHRLRAELAPFVEARDKQRALIAAAFAPMTEAFDRVFPGEKP